MKLYMTPGSCSLGIHLLLEECEALFEAHVVDLLAGANMSPAFLALNPRGSVPTFLCDDGRVLTRFEDIACWIAEAYPKKRLLPEHPTEAAELLDVLRYAVEVIHGEGFTRVFVSDRYAVAPDERGEVEEEGRQAVTQGFEHLVGRMKGTSYVGSRFSIADAAVFYVEFWAERIGMALPTRCQAHLKTMLRRGAVRQVLGEEGYASTLRKYPLAAPALP